MNQPFLEPPMQQSSPALKREMGFRDLVLFYIVSGLNVRWIAIAAGMGASSVAIWVLALFAFFIPLAASVLELSSRFPEEGGLYVWSRHAFGDFAGFMAGWTYWTSSLPYFPGVFYFVAGNALFMGGRQGQHLDGNRTYFMVFSLVALGSIVFLNVVGLAVGKWLNSFGAVAMCVCVILIIGIALLSAYKHGSATSFRLAELIPSASVRLITLWSALCFALAGCEGASFMGEEIKDPRRVIPPALVVGGILVTFAYIAGTLALLVALPGSEIQGIGGFMQATSKMGGRLGIAWVLPFVAMLVALGGLGNAASFFSSTSRLPFVAGIDHYLPQAFGRVHSRFGTPHIALISYGLASAVFVFLGQAGATVKEAYDVLVNMTVITYFLPFVFLFAAMIRLQREPGGPDVVRVRGGKPVAITLASIGLIATLLAIALSVIPPKDESHKLLMVAKIVGLTIVLMGLGVAIYVSRRKSTVCV
jgi:glutamate:GABA antiporter